MTKADVAHNGLQAKLKRTGYRATRRSFEQDARFLRKWNCAAKQSPALISGPPPTEPGAVPNFDRLIRARFNNRDYGRHKQTHSACVQSGSVLTDLGAGPFNSMTG